MDPEDTEYTKLSLEDRCVHKLWKARVHGYEEATKLFRQIPDEKSQEWNKFLGLVKKFVADTNAAAQEKGLEATLAYVESAGPAGKTVGEVMSHIVSKCLAAPKAKTKDLSIQVTLMYVEIERHEAVMDELIKGFDQKNPKVVSACVSVATQALREFGNKVINVKPLVKEIPKLLDHRDKAVRDEGKTLIVEIFRWVGVAVKPQLNNLKPVQLTELEAEFEKVMSERAVPTRYLRSQQQRQQQVAEEAGGDGEDDGGGEDEEDGAAPAVDPYDLMDPVDILAKLPKDFYDKLEAKKWQERKEALDELDKLLQHPKLESGDYADLVRVLKKIIQKDTNVMIVAMAGKSLACLATGLKKRFQPYALACVGCVLEKFKEKKQNVLVAMRAAIDAITQIVTLEAMSDDIQEALANKNPSVKSETASFLARYFTRCTPQVLDRKMLKVYTAALIKTLNESDPTVRDASAEALGTAMKVVGEKAIMAYLGDVEKLKLDKIKECSEKAVITAKIPKSRPATAPAKMATKEPVSRPAPKRPGASAPPKKPGAVVRKPGGPPPKGKAVSKKAAPPAVVGERELADEEVDETAAELLPADLIAGLVDGNWKVRLGAAEQMLQLINGMEKNEIPTQVLVRTVNKKPGLRDGNFQVLKVKFDIIKALAENAKFTKTSAQFCLQDVADKLGDAKTGSAASDALLAIAEATKLDFVATEVVTFAFSQKSPRLQQESLVWLAAALRDFGFVVQPKPVIENIRKALASTQVGVRTAGVSLLGVMFLYMGDALRPLVDNEKPSLLQQINAEFEKYEGQQAPTPTRGRSATPGEEGEGDEEEDEGPDPDQLQELLPRTDISTVITESVLSELSDKNWKVRDEALQKVAVTVNSSRYVQGNLGELPSALAARMQDSNKNIAQTAFSVCKHLGSALGVQGRPHVRTLLPAILQGLGDNKAQIRSIALECLKVWAEQCGIKELFEGEMVADALKGGNPYLRAELFQWLADNLSDARGVPKEELVACLPHLWTSVEDRTPEVRKAAQDAILPFMIHIGYETMGRQLTKMSTSSRMAISTMLDKARAVLPARPPPKGKGDGRAGGAAAKGKLGAAKPTAAAAAGPSKPKTGAVGKPAAGRSRKDEDLDLSPLLQCNNLKAQRISDEQKLKVIKWNFTTPREEFIELLKEQMTVANVNKSLMFNMFHSDFKYHLKAIDSLNEYLSGNLEATTANLDLILKWLTLRFFDTNPSVLLRGLEYLHSVFVMLAEVGYNMAEVEAASFVPYLLLKSGDSKDAVRGSVRAILQQITLVYSCSRLFTHVMEGLKSKNSRQRTECLDELATLIENYGTSVCQPTPPAALKEIARQISDRDNSVRTAALNCVVQAYYLEGERVYKMIGQISEKDMSLLTERIKRAGKNRPTIRTGPPEPVSKPTKVVRPNIVHQEPAYQQEPEEMEQPHYRLSRDSSRSSVASSSRSRRSRSLSSRETSRSPAAPRRSLNRTFDMEEGLNHLRNAASTLSQMASRTPRPISGKYCLDYNMLEDLETDKPVRALELYEMDLDSIVTSDVSLPNVGPAKSGGGAAMVTSPMSGAGPTAAAELLVGRLMSHDLERSTETCREVEAMLRREHSQRLLVPLTDSLLVTITNQLLILQKATPETHELAHMSANYTLLISILRMVFAVPEMAVRASQAVIRDLMSSLLHMLVEQKLERFTTADQVTRLTNSLVVRIIENSQHTRLVCAQLRMLYECIATPNTHAKFTELVMKSLWKVMRVIDSWDDSLDYTVVLKEVNHFLADFPSSTWRERANQVPLKTVKTLVHTMVQMKGAALLSYVGKEGEACPELIKMINKYISTTSVRQPEQRSQANAASKESSPHRLNKVTHHQLSTIFKKIGSKDQTKEGLEQLYDFQKQHPDADIAPFLEKASQFFQEYIEKGLKSIEKTRGNSTTASSLSSPQVAADTPSESGSDCAEYLARPEVGSEADYFRERLKELQSKAGLAKTAEDDNLTSDINRNRRPPTQMLDTQPRTLNIDTSPPPASDMEDIMQRLQRFKR